jgi:peptidoglycan/LPS O-acetylase OafA/YrhL
LIFGVRTGMPGVFETNHFREALNGSLWSLPYEVKMYVALVLCLAAARYNLYTPIVIFVSAALLMALSASGILPHPEENTWLTLSTLFLAGSALAATRIFLGLPAAIAGTGAVAAALAFVGARNVASELLITALVIATGCFTSPKWLRPPLDISYGVYLYAFPVQQVSAILFTNFWFALTFTCAITFLLATVSALFIERYALRLKSAVNLAVWSKKLKGRRLDSANRSSPDRIKKSLPAA